MRARSALIFILFGCAAIGLLHAQKKFEVYPGQSPTPLPPDYQEPHEWVWARMRYTPNSYGAMGGRRGGYGAWAIDYPKGDRILVKGLRRLSLLDTRSVEQVVDMDGSDDPYNWPFLYAVEVGRWGLEDKEAKQLRDYIDRGGFFMVDDFHCSDEWERFMDSFVKVFPDRDVVDIPEGDPITTTMFNLNLHQQIPGEQYVYSHKLNECDRNGRTDSAPHFRAVYDDKQRVQATIVHNSDMGDAFEFADSPEYPQEFAKAAFEVMSNYVIYDLTH
jgi:hypothetical protein